MRRFICSVFIVLAAAWIHPLAGQAQETAYLKGRIVGYDGKALPYAMAARVANAAESDRAVLEAYRVDGQGHFEAKLPAPAVHRITAGGLYHDRHTWPFYVEPGDTLEVEVRLGALGKPKADSLTVLWQTDHRSSFRDKKRMRVPMNDRRVYDVTLPATGDTLAYKVAWRLVYGGYSSSAALPADRLRPDRDHHQDALVATHGDTLVNITIDLSNAPLVPTSPILTWVRAPKRTLQFAEMVDEQDQQLRAYRIRRAEAQAQGGSGMFIEDDRTEQLKAIQRRIKKEKDPFAKQIWLVSYLNAGFAHSFHNKWEPDKRLAKEVMESIPPDSPLWSYWPGLTAALRAVSKKPKRWRPEERARGGEREVWDDRYRDYVVAYAQHPDSSAVRHWLGTAVSWAYSVGDFEALSQYYAQYMERMAGTRHAERMAHNFRENRTVDVGQVIPDFAFPGLDNPEVLITRANMIGRPYILTFWATWCGPCRPKTEQVATAHEQYQSAGLEVVGVSLDAKREHAFEFREKVHPMPWRNAYLDGWQPNKGTMADFQILKIPYSVLVDEQGTIVSIDDGTDLFWDDLIAFMDSR
ncbi:MAG: TlpA disulfide reductase family protein [Bacteroidota bacterium]